MKSAFILAATLALAACGGATTSSNSSGAASTAAQPANTASFASMINAVRAENGVAPVTRSSKLDRAAQRHAEDMLNNGFFSHTGSNGSTAGQRATAAGYRWSTVAENIAADYATKEEALQSWVNSPGHQANNISPNVTNFGFGSAGTGRNKTWVLMFARPL